MVELEDKSYRKVLYRKERETSQEIKLHNTNNARSRHAGRGDKGEEEK